MPGFVRHSADCTVVDSWVEVSHRDALPQPEPGFMWTEVPEPVCDWSVALVDGEPAPARLIRSAPVLLELKKRELRARVKALRDAAELSGCSLPAGRIDTDADSQRKISGAAFDAFIAKAAGEPWSLVWRLADDRPVEVTADQMIAVGRAVKAHVAAAQYRKNELDALIEQATSLADLELIDIDAGWPG